MEQDLLKEAIHLSQSGQKEQSRMLLSKLVQTDPANEVAWIWLIDACDSDEERKAILTWGLKRNPQSKMLNQALLRLESLRQQSSRSDENLVDPSIDTPSAEEDPSADLEWLRVEEIDESDVEEVSAEDLADIETIPDEEFSRLSQEFFAPLASESAATKVDEAPVSEKKEKRSLFDFLNRETAVDDPEPISRSQREEKERLSKNAGMEPGDLPELTNEPAGIEDKLKDAFEQAAPVEKRRRILLKSIPNVVKKVLFYLGISVLLVVLVLVGLYIVDQYFSTSLLWQQLFSN